MHAGLMFGREILHTREGRWAAEPSVDVQECVAHASLMQQTCNAKAIKGLEHTCRLLRDTTGVSCIVLTKVIWYP